MYSIPKHIFKKANLRSDRIHLIKHEIHLDYHPYADTDTLQWTGYVFDTDNIFWFSIQKNNMQKELSLWLAVLEIRKLLFKKHANML